MRLQERLDNLRLSQVDFGVITGRTPRQVNNWMKRHPYYVDVILDLVDLLTPDQRERFLLVRTTPTQKG